MTDKPAKKPKTAKGNNKFTVEVTICHDGRLRITLPESAWKFWSDQVNREEEKNNQGGEESGRDR